eukprot:Lithocolla_globosa_v1_NODE_442_length_4041_cov_30.407677.p4 type:complete len:300 gc:universal NODE_442_length_4041_cov_30.407677:3779-2880(-)
MLRISKISFDRWRRPPFSIPTICQIVTQCPPLCKRPMTPPLKLPSQLLFPKDLQPPQQSRLVLHMRLGRSSLPLEKLPRWPKDYCSWLSERERLPWYRTTSLLPQPWLLQLLSNKSRLEAVNCGFHLLFPNQLQRHSEPSKVTLTCPQKIRSGSWKPSSYRIGWKEVATVGATSLAVALRVVSTIPTVEASPKEVDRFQAIEEDHSTRDNEEQARASDNSIIIPTQTQIPATTQITATTSGNQHDDSKIIPTSTPQQNRGLVSTGWKMASGYPCSANLLDIYKAIRVYRPRKRLLSTKK